MSNKKTLVGLPIEDLIKEMESVGEKPFRARQLWHWIYLRGATNFMDMTSFSVSVREKLAEKYSINRPEIVNFQESIDGTKKWLLKLEDGATVETVFIPEEDRGAVCVSSQVGCDMGCQFCHTGTQKMVRNLKPEEIIAQVMVVKDEYKEWPTPKNGRMVSNIVMMGMGEPLQNYRNVATALKIIMAGNGIAISKRRITLSTCGIVPLFEKLGDELGVNLAVSLHAPNDEIRKKIMPVAEKYSIEELMKACRAYPASSNARRITFEYVMLKGINDSKEDAKELVRLVSGIPCKFNLIPFNPWPSSFFEPSEPEVIEEFANILNRGGYSAPIRTTRGDDILAACGQLKSKTEKGTRKSLITTFIDDEDED